MYAEKKLYTQRVTFKWNANNYRWNANLKKYPRQIQHTVKSLNMGVGVSCQNCYRLSGVNYSREKLHFRFATGSDFAPDGNKSNVCYKEQKGLYHGLLESWILLPSQDFTFSKPTMETLNTKNTRVKCL